MGILFRQKGIRNLTVVQRNLDNARVSPALPASSTQLSGTPEKVIAYHWLVVLIASCGWLFDCMDQRIFALSREPAIRELLGAGAADSAIKDWGAWATGIMMIGWATGGIIFGMMSDRLGRVKTMVITLLVYSGFTGLSGISQTVQQFLVFRFLMGLGVGG